MYTKTKEGWKFTKDRDGNRNPLYYIGLEMVRGRDTRERK